MELETSAKRGVESMKIENVVCPFCGCLCDDIEVEVDNGKIVNVKKSCGVGRALFLNHEKDLAEPVMYGKKASIDDVVSEAVRVLSSAKHPLVYGLSSTSIEAQRKAVRLAELIGGSIDQTSSVCHGPTTMAIQQSGIPTCTLGEAKNRADVVVFWGSNPLESHQRHYERYSLFAKGMLISHGRKDRKLVVVDVRDTVSSKLANLFVQVEYGRDYDIFTALRMLLKGIQPSEEFIGGVHVDKLKEMLDIMLSARYGVIFFGMGLTMTGGKYHNVEAAISLVRELNAHTRWSIEAMRGHYNVKGAGSVLAWQTGFPFSVNFSLGYPRYMPGEFSAVGLLKRREVDAMLVIASDPAATFPSAAVKSMMDIPVIAVDPKKSLTTEVADVVIPVAQVGVSAEGTAYRMDGVPLRLKKVVNSPYPSDEEIISLMIKGVERVRYSG